MPCPAPRFSSRLANRGVAALLLLAACLLGAVVDAQRRDQLRWWKGNLHTHSLWSDGDDYPEMIVDWYRRRGYHFLALSDHNILSQGQKWVDTEKRGGGDVLARYRERFRGWGEERVLGSQRQVRLKPLGEFRHLFEERDR